VGGSKGDGAEGSGDNQKKKMIGVHKKYKKLREVPLSISMAGPTLAKVGRSRGDQAKNCGKRGGTSLKFLGNQIGVTPLPYGSQGKLLTGERDKIHGRLRVTTLWRD